MVYGIWPTGRRVAEKKVAALRRERASGYGLARIAASDGQKGLCTLGHYSDQCFSAGLARSTHWHADQAAHTARRRQLNALRDTPAEG